MSTQDQLDKELASTDELLTEVWAAYDEGENYEDVEPTQYLEEMLLERDEEDGAYVLGTGGPHVEIGQGSAGPLLIGYWAGATSRKYSNAIERTAEYFDQLFDIER
jgi:hypothetical protein